MIQLHGETAPRLIEFFENKGASVETILNYLHSVPNSGTVETLFIR